MNQQKTHEIIGEIEDFAVYIHEFDAKMEFRSNINRLRAEMGKSEGNNLY